MSELVRLDDARSVAMQALQGFSDLLKHSKSDILVMQGHEEAIMKCVNDVMLGKIIINKKILFYLTNTQVVYRKITFI